ncbi:MAG: YraN family protein [Planctomycetota bacterium]
MWPFRRRSDSDLGRRGEQLALRLLKRRGLRILARNYRCPAGEIDLIVLDSTTGSEYGAETIAFVEVKTRSSDRYTAPESAVDTEKRRRMRKIADYYLARRQRDRFNVRFDVVSVLIEGAKQPRIEYIPDAF